MALQVLALQSCRACSAGREICFPAQFLCLEIGNLFPAETLQMENVSSMVPWEGAVEWQSHCDLLALSWR